MLSSAASPAARHTFQERASWTLNFKVAWLTFNPTGKPLAQVRSFGTMTRDLRAIGVLWKPVWNVLDGQFILLLVNPPTPQEGAGSEDRRDRRTMDCAIQFKEGKFLRAGDHLVATNQIIPIVSPHRISWSVGLLSLMSVVFTSVFLPAAVVFSLGGSPGAGAAAMSGGFVAGWFAYIGVMRMGVRRGWWS